MRCPKLKRKRHCEVLALCILLCTLQCMHKEGQFFRGGGGMSQRGSSGRAEGPGLHGYNKVTVKVFIGLYPSTFNSAVVKSYNTLSSSPEINTIIWFSAFTAAEEVASWNVLQSAAGCCFTPGSEALEFFSWKNNLVCDLTKNTIWGHTAHRTPPAQDSNRCGSPLHAGLLSISCSLHPRLKLHCSGSKHWTRHR